MYRKFPCRYKARAHWHITGRCNYRCKHCMVSVPHAKFGHPTTEQLLGIVDQLAECGVGWHDWLRGFDGAEEAVNRAFRLLQERGYHADAAMCLHRRNAHTLRKTVNHLAGLGVQRGGGYYAVDPHTCHFFKGGWYERFLEAAKRGEEMLGATRGSEG